ncbi:MAG: Nif11-like leader peptide family natural product precursor [Limisphaerales bacterium]
MNRPTEPSSGHLERFSQMVLADRQLHEQLRTTADLESFIALAVRLGRERGCELTAEEIRAAVQERRRAWFERWI